MPRMAPRPHRPRGQIAQTESRVSTRMLIRASAVIWVSTVLMLSNAVAGEFFERKGVAIDGFDAVAYFTQNKAVRGSKAFTSSYKGSLFYFSSAAHRDLFAANPEKFAPQYNGFCAYGVAKGTKASIEGERFAIVDGKLYLNYNGQIQATWNQDIPAHIRQADKNWPALN